LLFDPLVQPKISSALDELGEFPLIQAQLRRIRQRLHRDPARVFPVLADLL
jgi:hypothetical protein